MSTFCKEMYEKQNSLLLMELIENWNYILWNMPLLIPHMRPHAIINKTIYIEVNECIYFDILNSVEQIKTSINIYCGKDIIDNIQIKTRF